ncbi:capsule biosynthesis protein [Pseudooceanicola sediminis]|uniref:Capsule biosynthesis protein n=1 Tax=Pseudooceanicola sediminis TaxID=2211117 RepID=A0A399J2B0_9RHOB|nr:capsule biosynthesis protein [Puniceibacterium sp. HSS470]RII38609.1 capsule biosynthesis protein [Pseudooceanicola sediminis]
MASQTARVAPPVPRSRLKRRHWLLLGSFAALVVAPLVLAAWYLWARAADQYASTVGFSVRTEEQSPAIALLGGITDLSGSSSSDTDILYEYLHSQELVADMDAALDLRHLWAGAGSDWRQPGSDPVFAFDPAGAIEDLVEYWQRMVRIRYDGGTGLIEVRVLAFQPEDATRIAGALLTRASDMINTLSAIAQADAIRTARTELALARDRLKEARRAVTAFRNRHQLVDPGTDIASQAGLLAQLQAQLAEALIDVDMLRETARDSDPRLKQATRRIVMIERRIAAERAKLGMGAPQGTGDVLANLVGQYEALVVDREFAQQSYTTALASFDAAQAEARRKSRYLAPYIRPTGAETSRFPERGIWMVYLGAFAGLGWLIVVLGGYAIKDRR